MEKIRIGLDAKRLVRNGTGLGSYSRTLVNDLAQCDGLDLLLYAPDEGREALRCQVQEADNLHYRFSNSRTALGKALWRTKGIVSQLRREDIDVYHGLSGELPLGIRRSGIRSVVTIHDLIFLRHPEFYHWLDTKIYAWKFRQTVREADHIIAISECTRRDVVELGGVDPSKVSIIYQSYSPCFNNPSAAEGEKMREGLPQRYILNVGTVERRKNVLLAVKALHHLPDDVSLVVVGRSTPYTDEVRAYAEKNGLAHRLHLLGSVSIQQLPALYAGAETFVYPSVYEGFGIPIIEAISSGLPVVACTGSCLEEAGGPDSLYVAPDDAEGLAAALRQTLRGADGREQRIERSRQYIRRFQGTDVAGQVADLYRQLLVR